MDKKYLISFLEQHLTKAELELIGLRFGLGAKEQEDNNSEEHNENSSQGLMTYKHIAERYGLSIGTMRVRVENIIWKIRNIMKYKGFFNDNQFLLQ